MYAIVRTGGKQYRVEEGRSVQVERLPGEEGSRLELSDVLLIADDGDVTVGTPVIEGARVLAQVEVQGRDKKIIVFKYKSKVRTRKKTGHRQSFTRLTIEEILRPGQEPKKIEKPKRSPAPKAAESEDPSGEAEAPAAEPEAPAAEPKAKAAARQKPARKAPEEAKGESGAETPAAEAATEAATEKKAPRRRTPKAAAATEDESADTPAAEAGDEKPKTARKRPAGKKQDEDKETD